MKRRKAKPSPPRWMYYEELDDNCWGCKTRSNCGSCKRIKQGLKIRNIKSKHDKQQNDLKAPIKQKGGEVGMKITQSWKRNTPTTDGYSLTITYTYSSRYLHEIEEIEKKLPKGMIVMDTDKPQRMYPLEQEGR